MQTVKAGDFKARCLALLDQVANHGDSILVTKRGRPVALVTAPPSAVDDPRQRLFGSVVFEGDLVAPIDEAWEADRDRA